MVAFQKIRENIRWYFLVVLLVAAVFINYAAIAQNREGKLTIAFMDIGQGDAIYIEAPNGNQIIIDGGPDRKILSELAGLMPFYDKSIDMLVVTNPDKDHMAGFIDVLESYDVDGVMEPGTVSTTATYKALEKAIADEHAEKIIARRGTRVVLDEDAGVYLTILFPDRDVSGLATNDGSIIAKLTYGKTSVMLTGDAPQKIEDYVLAIDSTGLKSDILKVGHHGSRTSTVPEFVSAVAPRYAVISDAQKNSYGHPHQETLDTLAAAGVEVLRTDELGTIVFKSDGEGWEKGR